MNADTTPRCAACLLPIERGTFVITGTEVIHKACARAGRTTRSWTLLADLAKSKAALREAIRSHSALSTRITSLEEAAPRILRDLEDARRSKTTVMARAANAQLQHRADLEAAQREIADLTRRIAALTPPAAESTVATPVDNATDLPVGDAWVERFRLLEFD